MTAAYFDASALVKLLNGEEDHERASGLWAAADFVTASHLAYAEVPAALAAGHRNRRYDDAGLRDMVARWERLRTNLRPIKLTASVAIRAGALAERHALTGADAVHLASAEAIGSADLIVATWDRRLATAAQDAGYRVLPGTAA